jgi:hypothetical protein
MTTPFRIDILDTNNTKLGTLLTATTLKDTRCLDKVGSASFSFPATDAMGANITAGSRFDIYDDLDGYLGRFSLSDKTVNMNNGMGMVTVNCNDQLIELNRVSVRFRREYEGLDVASVVSDLVSLAGWTVNGDVGIGETTITYNGESVFRAVDALRDRWGQHFRLSANESQIDFGAFGASSGVRFVDAHGIQYSEFASHPEVALVDSIKENTDPENIVNRVIVLGGGQGGAQLTMALATYVGSYALASRANPDGTLQYFIEDSQSIIDYGVREQTVTFSEITPVSNATVAIIAAANALKQAGEVYLTRNKDPRIEYSLSVKELRTAIRVGDTIRLAYQYTTPEGYRPIDVNADFYLMDITRKRDVNGKRDADVTISSLSERRTSDSDVMIGTVNDLKSMKMYKQPFPYQIYFYDVDFIQGGFFANRQIYPVFNFRIDDSVTSVSVLKMRIQTEPLFSIFGLNVSTWGTAGTAIAAVYRLIKSAVTPRNLAIIVNGVNVTTALYGSATIPGTSAIDETFDVTTLFTEDAADIHADHTIQITSATDSTSTATNIPDYTATNELGVSFGRVTITITGVGSSQAIISY